MASLNRRTAIGMLTAELDRCKKLTNTDGCKKCLMDGLFAWPKLNELSFARLLLLVFALVSRQ